MELPKHKTSWGGCIAKDKEFHKTTKKQLSGGDLQQNRDLLQQNTTCTNRQGISQDDKEAGKWYRLAAEQGFGLAQFNLGLLYYEGKGVPQDNKEAVKWWRLSAGQRVEQAQYNLVLMHDDSLDYLNSPN